VPSVSGPRFSRSRVSAFLAAHHYSSELSEKLKLNFMPLMMILYLRAECLIFKVVEILFSTMWFSQLSVAY